MTTCPACGAAMVLMVLSSFCPNDCDRPKDRDEPRGPDEPGSAGILLNLSEDVTLPDGRVYRAWLYNGRGPVRMAELPSSIDGLYRGWNIILTSPFADERDVPGALRSLRTRGIQPGWDLRQEDLDRSFRYGTSTMVFVRTQ